MGRSATLHGTRAAAAGLAVAVLAGALVTVAPRATANTSASKAKAHATDGTRYAKLRELGLATPPPRLSPARLAQLRAVPDQPVPVTPVPSTPADRPPQATPSGHEWMAQIDYETTSGGAQTPWTLGTFQYLANRHLTGIELNLRWNNIEPQRGQFQLSTLTTYLKYAAQTHLKLVPIFWESVWGGNNPGWLNAAPEQTNSGALDQQPAMWSGNAFTDYSTYVTTVLGAITHLPGYGGSYVNYGWLDAMWGPPPSGGGMAGYAAVDVAAFHQWLATQYPSVAALNLALGTSYASFGAVPAFQPGEAHFAVYQKFRIASYHIIMTRLLHNVRRVTDQPLYLYFGGDMDDVGVLGNMPDQVFDLAGQFKAVVSLDDADNTALADLFGYLSQGYGVPLLNEWTPIPGNTAEVAFWQGHYTLEGANRLGEDYFLYGGGQSPDTFAKYLALHDTVNQVTGHLPAYRVGILVGYNQVTQGLQEERVPGGDAALATYLDTSRPAAQVVTDDAVLAGQVDLRQFSVLIDWSNDATTPGIDPRLAARLARFRAAGGTIVHCPLVNGTPTPPAGSAPAAFVVAPQSTQIETWAAIDNGRVWVTVANGEEDLPVADTLQGGGRITLGDTTAYSGALTVEPVVGLPGPAWRRLTMASADLFALPISSR